MKVKCQLVKIDALVDYKEGLELQEKAFQLVHQEQTQGIILLLQHKHVFTVGTQGGQDNLLMSKQQLERLGITVFETRRGGNITYHGPGQLVAYPILNLNYLKKDTRWYINQLEEVIIQTLKAYGITAGRKPKYVGVWIGDKKIAAIGVGMKKWITMHGFAFNIQVQKKYFTMINPCGITEFGIASLDDYIAEVNDDDVIRHVQERFSSVLDIELNEVTLDHFKGRSNVEYIKS